MPEMGVAEIKQNILRDQLFQHENPYFHANEIILVCIMCPLNTKFVPHPHSYELLLSQEGFFQERRVLHWYSS